jgi:glucokinase
MILALDVGGTKIAGALVTPDGQIVARRTVPAPRGELADPGLGATMRLVRELAEDAADLGSAVSAIGAGFAEYVDRGGRLASREVLGWVRQPGDDLREMVPGVVVTIASDVRCGALAEAIRGAGHGLDSFLYVSLGTGLSSAFVNRGEPIAGHRGEAIAIGEWPAPGFRNLEAACSGAGIAARFEAETGIGGDGSRAVVALAAEGDLRAQAILADAGDRLGSALADAVALLDPEAVILGGGLGAAITPLHDALRDAYTERASRRAGAPALRSAGLGADACLLGAAIVAGRAATADDARILPELSVRRGRAAIAFYQAAFGAVEEYRVGGTDQHEEVVARLSAGGAQFWVSDEAPAHGNHSPESLGGTTARMLLIVDDPAALQERAIATGATEVAPVATEHGWLLGRIVDPFGHHWEIGRPLGTWPPAA